MTPQDFNAWLDQLWLSDEDAAERLGVELSRIATFKQSGAPRYIALACRALERGLVPWSGRQPKRAQAVRRRSPSAAAAGVGTGDGALSAPRLFS
ncbi:hypothetical protein [Consotaella aegiceratis]|uniref:hypothetical protein n=1 Tax=Consotaella aegiceratis TaxID=3097961 RepID=UPI002F429EC5